MRICIYCSNRFEGKTWNCPGCGAAPHMSDGFATMMPDHGQEKSSYRPEYFQQLSELEGSSFWFRARKELILYALNRYFPGMRSYFEIGCGTGFVLGSVKRAFPEASLTGSDIFSEGLSFVSERVPKAELLLMDANNIPFENEFDVIGAYDVLEHIEDDLNVLRQMHRALKPDGGVLLTVPHHAFLWSAADERACHVRRYSARELTEKVTASGFRIERLTAFISLLFPAMLISRLLNRDRREFDVLDELRIGSVMNKVFENILKIERSLLRAGINYPFGGSLLLAGKKI